MPTIQSGWFVSTGEDFYLSMRSDVDSIKVYNYTTAAAVGGVGCEFTWVRGMDAGTGLVYSKTAATDALELTDMAAGGFTLFDTSIPVVVGPVATTASTNAAQPVVSTGSTAGLVTGEVVILSGINAAPTICGIPFDIDTVVANTSFRIRWPLANAPGAVGGAGFYRHAVSGSNIFSPKLRYIANMESVGEFTVVTTTVVHGYAAGDKVRLYVPSAANGMIQADNLQATILAIDTVNNTFTLDLDSSSFSAFVWPAAVDSPYTPAQCMAFGSPAAGNLTLLEDATRNESAIGIILGGGVGFPGGDTGDIMYYVAEKSDLVTVG